MNDSILHLLGLAKKAGRLELGEEPVGAAARARQAKLILMASDAAPNSCRRAAHFGEAGHILFLQLPTTKAELGRQFGRGSVAMLALTDSGFAASIAEKLVALDPERYAPAAQQLRTKADRVYQRQKEQRQHEKNLQQGKKKPWAPPPPSSPSKTQGKDAAPRADQPPRAKGEGRPPFQKDGRPGGKGPGRPPFQKDGRPGGKGPGRPPFQKDGRPGGKGPGKPPFQKDGRPAPKWGKGTAPKTAGADAPDQYRHSEKTAGRPPRSSSGGRPGQKAGGPSKSPAGRSRLTVQRKPGTPRPSGRS